MTPANIVDAIREEWGKLAPAVQYVVLLCSLFIVSIWLDKQLDLIFFKEIYNFPIDIFRLTLSQLIFGLSLVFLTSLFLMGLILRFLISLRVIWYKFRYPLRNLNKSFYIVYCSGRAFLIDKEKKQIRWVKSWQTALDLDFAWEWTDLKSVDLSQPNGQKIQITTKDGKSINLSNYKYADGIRTEGKP